jgi:2-octaprenyl-6-methoxyphenol hydroxylase
MGADHAGKDDMRSRSEAVVVGGGPAGVAAALALGQAGADVVLAAPPHPGSPGGPIETRTAALFAGSINLLKNLGAWEAVAAASAPIRAIRILDDTGALLRAPEVVFTAAEVGLDAFGWNVPNGPLVSALLEAAGRPESRVRLLPTAGIAEVALDSPRARLTSREGLVIEADLVAGADGRGSICRAAAGIGTRAWSYDQAALACSFQHSRPHNDISTEFHRPHGPFTLVPLPGLASSLVWVERPEEAQRLQALEEEAFRKALEIRLQGLLGDVGAIGRRAVFPLSGLTAETFGQNRVALIGEAAHVIPPIGAQGLNLGLRDAATLADCVADALGAGRDIGGSEALSAYSARRRPDIGSRITTVDVLNRSLLSTLLPVQLARGLGLIALKTLGPLRRIAIREGLQWNRDVPALLEADGTRRLQERTAQASRPSAA